MKQWDAMEGLVIETIRGMAPSWWGVGGPAPHLAGYTQGLVVHILIRRPLKSSVNGPYYLENIGCYWKISKDLQYVVMRTFGNKGLFHDWKLYCILK